MDLNLIHDSYSIYVQQWKYETTLVKNEDHITKLT